MGKDVIFCIFGFLIKCVKVVDCCVYVCIVDVVIDVVSVKVFWVKMLGDLICCVCECGEIVVFY